MRPGVGTLQDWVQDLLKKVVFKVSQLHTCTFCVLANPTSSIVLLVMACGDCQNNCSQAVCSKLAFDK